VVVVLVAVLGGYGFGLLVKDDETPSVAVDRGADGERAAPTPWYKTQAPPPELVTIPDAPLLPEPGAIPPSMKARAYEEALPDSIYEPPVPRPTRPAQPPPAKARPPAGQQVAALAALPPWRRYAVPTPDTGGWPMIAVVIDDLGIDRRRTARAIGLKGPMTLSFLTYADGLAEQTAVARAAGHELMLHVGMEPASASVDPGPNVLTSDAGADELRRRLDWGLARFDGYVGINNHMGSKFTADAEGVGVLMTELKRRGLMFLDSRTTGRTVAAKLARRAGVPVVERNVFLDNVGDVDAVKARLAEVERIARRSGSAVAIGHPRDATLTALAGWLGDLERRGFVLVPVSALASAPGS